MPEPTTSGPPLVRFGVFEVDLRAGELRKNGAKVRLEGQPFQILALLLERPGQVVTREELKQKLWPADTFVDFEHSINAAVKRLREALDDSADTPRFIETLPRRGYRFIYPLDGTAARLRKPIAWWRRRWVASLLLAALPGVLAGLMAANVGGWRDRIFGTGGGAPIASLAVLPLENLTGDPEQEYFVDGLHDELITQLAQISSLKVIARTSVQRYKQEKKPVREIGRELGVEGVVEGSVRQSGDRIRITVQLIHAPSDRHLWAEAYERDLRDVLALQNEVTRAIVAELRIQLTPQEQVRLASARPTDPEVYKLYLKGHYYEQKWTEEALRKALDFYRQAIELDPTFAPAWEGVGSCYQNLSGYMDRKEAHAKAKAALLRALELDDTLRTAHQALARIYMNHWDWKNAEREFLRAQEVDPSWHGPSLYFTRLGRFDEAIRAQREEVERDPLGFNTNLVLAWTYYMARRHDEAIIQLKKTMELDPGNRLPHYQLAWNYAKKGMYKEAVAKCDAFSRPDPEVRAGDDCGWVYAVAGRRAEALQFIKRIRQKSNSSGGDRSAYLAMIYDALGDRETAIKLLYEAYDKRDGGLLGLKVAPKYSDALRADPRFQELIRRIGFPEVLPALLAGANRGHSK